MSVQAHESSFAVSSPESSSPSRVSGTSPLDWTNPRGIINIIRAWAVGQDATTGHRAHLRRAAERNRCEDRVRIAQHDADAIPYLRVKRKCVRLDLQRPDDASSPRPAHRERREPVTRRRSLDTSSTQPSIEA